MSYDIIKRESEKMHTLDRVLVLQVMEGKDPLESGGKMDKRLFTGDNKLHAVYNTQTGLWYMRYERGSVPGALDVQFSELPKLLDYVRNYFARRNIEITEVQG